MRPEYTDPIVVPVPDVLRQPLTGTSRGIYVIEDEDLLVAESDNGYVGIPLECPHDGRLFEETGCVRHTTMPDGSRECALYCNAHAIFYSLTTGDALKNKGAPEDDPGKLHLYDVKRQGDNFIIESFT